MKALRVFDYNRLFSGEAITVHLGLLREITFCYFFQIGASYPAELCYINGFGDAGASSTHIVTVESYDEYEELVTIRLNLTRTIP